MKYKKLFNDYFMQQFYENLRKDNYTKDEAVKETVNRFKAYDEQWQTVIF
jgi:hypothetical protein